MHTGSRNRLTPQQVDLFPGDTLFARLARAVCGAGVLPRKELYEAWEVARRVHRRLRGGRVVDLCCGHGLLAQVLLLLDETATGALAVDTRLTDNHLLLADAVAAAWPRLQGRVAFRQARLEDVELFPDDLIVSAHACGDLTDTILTRAIEVGARVAVLPCCQVLRTHGDLDGWLDKALAVDVERAVRLRAAGYQIHTQAIPAEISPKNRLLLASPD
jgi:SAM-dependent methyltransferase